MLWLTFAFSWAETGERNRFVVIYDAVEQVEYAVLSAREQSNRLHRCRFADSGGAVRRSGRRRRDEFAFRRFPSYALLGFFSRRRASLEKVAQASYSTQYHPRSRAQSFSAPPKLTSKQECTTTTADTSLCRIAWTSTTTAPAPARPNDTACAPNERIYVLDRRFRAEGSPPAATSAR